MTEKQKRDAEQLYNPNYDKELGIEIMSCKQKCHEYNLLSPTDFENKSKLLDDILGSHGQNTMVLRCVLETTYLLRPTVAFILRATP